MAGPLRKPSLWYFLAISPSLAGPENPTVHAGLQPCEAGRDLEINITKEGKGNDKIQKTRLCEGGSSAGNDGLFNILKQREEAMIIRAVIG